MVSADDFIPLSALQHYAFCPRQCALIHLEQVWMENAHTAEGRIMHETAHSGDSRLRDGVRIVTDLPLKSAVLGVSGRAYKTGIAGQRFIGGSRKDSRKAPGFAGLCPRQSPPRGGVD